MTTYLRADPVATAPGSDTERKILR